MSQVEQIILNCSRRREGWRGHSLVRSLTAVSCLVLLLCLLPVTTRAEELVDVAKFKQRADEWLTLRREIAHSQGEWQKEQELLKSEITLLNEQKAHLTSRLAESKSALQELEKRLSILSEKLPIDGKELEQLEVVVEKSETYLRLWQTRLPAFSQDSFSTVFAQLAPETVSEDGLGERLQRLVNLHSQLQQFTRTVHVGSLILTPPNKKPRQMEAVFLGTSVGYAVALDGTQAAVAFPGEEGWQWNWRPELAKNIRNVLACYRKEQPAAFIPLPVKFERKSR